MEYSEWAKRYQVTPHLYTFLRQLPDIPISLRKVLLTITRVQCAPSPPRSNPSGDWPRISRRFEHELNTTVYTLYSTNPVTRREITLLNIITPIRDLFECPLAAGFLSIHIRSVPYTSYEDIPALIQSTTEKELTAAITGYTRYRINFSPFLSMSTHHRDKPIAPNLPGNPWLSWQIFQSLLAVKSELRGRKIYPRIPTKTFGSKISENIWKDLRASKTEYYEPVTTIAELERLYYKTGWRPEGEVEMRSAWKYNDLKPRVYYAQGPTVFNASLYAQPIFNTLLDAFTACHRILRFSTPTSSLEGCTLFIYDYSSFTSSLTESTRFIYALADFYEDVEVEVLDTREGWLFMSVGDILRSYADTCNVNPEFDVHKLVSSEGRCSLRSHNCGMLGVPGNLASCTVLHAIHLMYVCGSMTSCRCVGDDGMAIVYGVDTDEFVDQVNNLGEVEASKTEWWFEEQEIVGRGAKESWHFTKRPFWRNFNSVFRGDLYVYPSLELILGLKDNFHRSALSGLSEFEQKRKTLRQVLRLWSTLSSSVHFYTEDSITLLLLYLRNVYITMKLPFNGGRVPFKLADGEKVSLLVPSLPRSLEDLQEDPYVNLGELLVGETVVLPAFRQVDDICFGPPGVTFVSRSTGVLSVLTKIGVLVQVEMCREEFYLEAGYSSYNSFRLSCDYSFSYLYEIAEELPDWF